MWILGYKRGCQVTVLVSGRTWVQTKDSRFQNWLQTCWLALWRHFINAGGILQESTVCSRMNICSGAHTLPTCSSQRLYFMGKCWQDSTPCYAPWRALSPQNIAFSASPVVKPYLVCKWVVWKNWAPRWVTVCFPPTHSFVSCSPPRPPHHHSLSEGSWYTGWDQICGLAKPLVSSAWQGLEIRALVPLRGWGGSGGPQFKSQGIRFLKPRSASLIPGNFPLLLMWQKHSSVLVFPACPEEQTLFCWNFNSFSFCVRGVFTFFNLRAPFVSVLYIWYVFIPCTLWNHSCGMGSGLLAQIWLWRIKNF